MTEMACPEPRMSQDQWLINFLGSSPTFVLDGNNLTLTSGTTVVTLLDREVAEPDQPLVGPTWSLTTIVKGDVASSVPIGISASFIFADDGTFSFHDGCNSGGGKYVVDGDHITFSEVVQTEMACVGAAGQVEQAVLAVMNLNGSVAFAIDAGSLSFTSGADGLQFSSTVTE
jgi:heat shock protein HslJ